MNGYDISVFIAYLVLVMGIGFCCRRGRRSSREFYLAGRSMGWFPVGLSVMITVFSAINFVAFPQEIINHGCAVVTALPVFILVGIPISLYFIPRFYKMEATSAYEFLESRFDLRVRCLASAFFILWRIVWIAVMLFATAKILAMITGFTLPVLIVLCGVGATVYTAFGGIRAVIWTDVAQFMVLVGGIVGLLIFTVVESGTNLQGIIDIAFKADLFRPFASCKIDSKALSEYLSLDPNVRISLWSCLIGVFVAFMTRYGADQIVIQRYFVAKSLKIAQISFWWNIVCAVLSISLLAFLGIAVYAFAVRSQLIMPGDRLTPPLKSIAFLIKSFPMGGCGLLTAALLAATMSSVDSGINACSAAYFSDFHIRLFNRDKSERESWRYSVFLTSVLGGISIILALVWMFFLGKNQSVFVMVNKTIHGVGSPLLAIILLAFFSKKMNSAAVFWGGVCGVVFSLFSVVMINDLALHYYAVLNLLATLGLCLVFSTWMSRKHSI